MKIKNREKIKTFNTKVHFIYHIKNSIQTLKIYKKPHAKKLSCLMKLEKYY